MDYEIRNVYREAIEPSECIPRKMTDEERLRYGKPRPNSNEPYWILKNPAKCKEYQNTYGLSDEHMADLKQCMAQKGYENQLYAKVENRKAIKELATATYKTHNQAEFEAEIIPMGPIIQ
jgi:hypothetical protein